MSLTGVAVVEQKDLSQTLPFLPYPMVHLRPSERGLKVEGGTKGKQHHSIL